MVRFASFDSNKDLNKWEMIFLDVVAFKTLSAIPPYYFNQKVEFNPPSVDYVLW
jgi:hypothetical protein